MYRIIYTHMLLLTMDMLKFLTKIHVNEKISIPVIRIVREL